VQQTVAACISNLSQITAQQLTQVDYYTHKLSETQGV